MSPSKRSGKPPANGTSPPAISRRVLFLHPSIPLNAETVCGRLELAGIDRSIPALRTLTELELLLVYDYVERLFLAASCSKIQTRPRPYVLDAIDALGEAPQGWPLP